MLSAVTAALGQSKWPRFGARPDRGRKLGEFDTLYRASRGVLGSLVMMGMVVSGTKPQIAWIGAMIVTLSFAFNTFSQQVIAVVSAERNAAVPTRLPAATSYDSWEDNCESVEWRASPPVIAAL